MPKFKQTRPAILPGFPYGHPAKTESTVFEAEVPPVLAPYPAVPVAANTPLHDWQEDKEEQVGGSVAPASTIPDVMAGEDSPAKEQ